MKVILTEYKRLYDGKSPNVLWYMRDGGNLENFRTELKYLTTICKKSEILLRALMQIKRTPLIALRGEVMLPAGEMNYIEKEDYYLIIGSLCT